MGFFNWLVSLFQDVPEKKEIFLREKPNYYVKFSPTSYCPHCGARDWGKPKKMLNGYRCTHPKQVKI